MFGNLFGGSAGDMPGMGDIMKFLALFTKGGDKRDTITEIVTKYATDDKISFVTGNLINGLDNLQRSNNTRYVLLAESTRDSRDIIVKILARDPVTFELAEYQMFYLSQITQAQIISVINLFFSNDTTGTKQLNAGS